MSEQSSSLASAGSAEARPAGDAGLRKTVFAGGSVLGAIAMSSCCIVPLALFSVGVTSAWIGNLAALYPYKWIFFLVTAGFLAGGFYTAYRKPAVLDCPPDAACATPISDRVNRIVLWTATALAGAALAFPYVAPILLDV